jgi:transposase InsO family protein
MCELNGMIYAYDRLLIPNSARLTVLTNLHHGHLTADRMRAKAADSVIWPGINNDIIEFVERCETCQRHRRSNPALPLQWSVEGSQYPMQRVGLDIAQTDSSGYWLVMLDNYSNYLFASRVSSASTENVCNMLIQWFSIVGIPKLITADSGSCFTSQRFQDNIQCWGTKIRFSAPYHHAGNGLAESGVKMFKKLSKDIPSNNKEEILKAVIRHNNTKRDGKPAPTSLFFNRQILDDFIQRPSELTRGPNEHSKYQQQQDTVKQGMKVR